MNRMLYKMYLKVLLLITLYYSLYPIYSMGFNGYSEILIEQKKSEKEQSGVKGIL